MARVMARSSYHPGRDGLMATGRKPGLPAPVLAWLLAAAVVWVGIGALLLGWYPR